MRCSRRHWMVSSAAAVAWPRHAWAQTPHTDDRLAEYQKPPQALPKDLPKLSPLLVDHDGNPIADRHAWEKQRAEIRALWFDFLRPLAIERPASSYEVLATEQLDGCERELVRYESEPGIHVEAYLISPSEPAKQNRAAGVAVFHATADHTIRQPAGLEKPTELHFGLKLAQRGMVTLSPRCFLWQDKRAYNEQVKDFQRRHPSSKGMAKMLWDAQRAVDVLANHPLVDPSRIGAVGHSLGAKEVLYLAAFDERVRASVSSEGGIGTTFSNWEAPWYLGEELATEEFRREHHELLALAAPRAFLLVGGDSADGDRSWPFIEAALSVYRLYGEPCRLGLLNHKRGHAVPLAGEIAIHHWLEAYL